MFEDPHHVTLKCKTTIKVVFLYINLCLSVVSDSLLCSITSTSLLTIHTSARRKPQNPFLQFIQVPGDNHRIPSYNSYKCPEKTTESPLTIHTSARRQPQNPFLQFTQVPGDNHRIPSYNSHKCPETTTEYLLTIHTSAQRKP
jgi:hypothetical protein